MGHDMAETKTHPNPAASTVKADATNAHQMALIQRIQSYAVLAFVFASVLAFCGAIYQITRDFGLTFLKDQGDGIVWSKLIAAYPGSVVLIAASIIGAVVGVAQKLVSKEEWKRPIPFGPYLTLGAVLWVFAGTALMVWYFGLLGFGKDH